MSPPTKEQKYADNDYEDHPPRIVVVRHRMRTGKIFCGVSITILISFPAEESSNKERRTKIETAFSD
jgi:hypothetical protein